MASGSGWSAAAAVLPTVVRVDGRRAASWIAAAAAAAVGWRLAIGSEPVAAGAAAVACGGLLVTAAIGRLPAGVIPGDPGPWPAQALTRAACPGLGLLLGGGLAAVGGGPARGAAMTLALASGLAAAGFHAVGLGRRSARANPPLAGRVLVASAVAAAAALVAEDRGGNAAVQAVAAAAAWGLAAALLLADPTAGPWEASVAAEQFGGADAVAGIAMATSLVAMAVCFFLAPQVAWAYPVLALGWFVCLAVPPATDFGGSEGSRRLVRSAAGRPQFPGTLGRALAITATMLGILGWPAVVAVLLTAAGGDPGPGPTATLAWLGAGAVFLLAAVAFAARHGRGEAARAVVLALAALATVWLPRPPRAAEPPSLPALPAAPRPGAVLSPRGLPGTLLGVLAIEPRVAAARGCPDSGLPSPITHCLSFSARPPTLPAHPGAVSCVHHP